MVRVEKIGTETTEPKYPCPRGCGDLTNQRKLTNLRKHYKCKKCKGTNLSVDEINAQMLNRGIKKNKLERFLNSGKQGNLACPKCLRKMQILELSYDKDRLPSTLDKSVGALGGGPLGPEGMIIGLPILVIYGIAKLASKKTKKAKPKNLKSVVIDSCGHCNSFWFDKNELKELTEVGASKANIEQMDALKIELAKKETKPTKGVVTAAKKQNLLNRSF